MGKGSRNRELRITENQATANTAVKLSKKQLIEKEEKKAKIKKYITMIAVIAIIAAIIVAIIISAVNKSKAKLENQIAATSDEYTIDNAMMAYLTYYQYQNFASNYQYYLSMFGLDTSKSLKSQSPDPTYFPMLTGESVSTGMTWHDYFVGEAVESAEYYTALAAKAKADGFKLDSDDKELIKNYLTSLENAAAQNGYSVSAYLANIFAPGVTKSAIKRVLEMELLAEKEVTKLTDSYEFTDDEMDAYRTEHPETFLKFDYVSYSFEADYADDADDEAKKAAREEAKKKADELLAKATDLEAFKAEIQKLAKAEADEAAIEKAVKEATDKAKTDGLDEAATKEATDKARKEAEEAAAKDEKDYTESFVKEGAQYTKDDKLTEWASAEGRNVGDKTVLADSEEENEVTEYTVYYLTKLPYFDDYAARSIRHILISVSEDEENPVTAEQAKAKAEEILAEYEKGEKTAEKFGELANKYSEDPGSNTNGGLYEDFRKGETYEAFDAWLFDESRAAGDTGVIETEAGAHVMYYVGEGTTAWKMTAEDKMKDEKFEEDTEALKKQYPLTVNNDILANIP